MSQIIIMRLRILLHLLTVLVFIVPELSGAKDKNSQEMQSKKELLKQAFKNYSPEERKQAIQQAKTMRSSPLENQDQAGEIDLYKLLGEICGPAFEYLKDSKHSLWPEVSCNYTPDDGGLGGATSKFMCLFEDPQSKSGFKKLRVKYASPKGSYSRQEIVPAFMASFSAYLLGFYSEVFCPAKVVCKNCPSNDPWSNNRAAATPGKVSASFDRALVEIPVRAMTIRNPGPSAQYSQGLEFDELLFLSSDSQTRRQQIIEREAWLLWMNLLADLDAFQFNQKISCLDGKIVDDKALCRRSIVYTHDYGHAYFEKLQMKKWAQNPVLIQQADGSCLGGLSGQNFKEERNKEAKGILLSPIISEEARLSLFNRLSLLTDGQWRAIFELIQAQEVSTIFNKVHADTFVKTMKAKIAEIGTAKCMSVDEKKSVLSR